MVLKCRLRAFEPLGPISDPRGNAHLLDHEADHVLKGNAWAGDVCALQVDAFLRERSRSDVPVWVGVRTRRCRMPMGSYDLFAIEAYCIDVLSGFHSEPVTPLGFPLIERLELHRRPEGKPVC